MTPDERLHRVAAQQHGAFSLRQARDFGSTREQIRHRIRTGRWLVRHRGACVIAGSVRTWEQDVMVALLSYGPKAVASHTTAGRLWDVWSGSDLPIHVMLVHAHHRQAKERVRPHQAKLRRSDVRIANGIPVTSPHRTLVDLATELSGSQLEAALDRAIVAGLVSVRSMQRYIADRRLERKRGMGRLRRLLADRSKGAPESGLERLFIRKAKASGLPNPARQIPVGNRRIDLGYPDVKVAIEIDSLAHHFSGVSFVEDRRRQNEIVLDGWLPLAFTEDDLIERWPAVHETVERTLKARAAMHGSASTG